jgi:hypothetical protein
MTMMLSLSSWSVSASVESATESEAPHVMTQSMNMDCEHQQNNNDCPHCHDQHQCAQGHGHCFSPVAIPLQQTRLNLNMPLFEVVEPATVSQLSTHNTPLFRPPITA